MEVNLFILGCCLALFLLAVIDLKTMTLPNSITIPLTFSAIVFNKFSANSFASTIQSVIGALLGYCLIWLINKIYYRLTKRNGIGMGDAKLLAFIGALLGPIAIIPTLFIGSLLGILGGLIWLKLNKLNTNSAFPFGPYLCITEVMLILDSQLKIGIVKFLAL